MARDTKLSDDLATLAAEERQRLGEVPTAEQLIALRDGELPTEEAERIRDQLVVDPELASVYLELKRGVDLETPSVDMGGEISGADVDDAWRGVASKLDRTIPLSVDPAYEPGKVVPIHHRGWGKVLGLAATLTIAMGLLWLLATRGSLTSAPEREYQDFRLTGEVYRDGSSLRISKDVAGVAFHIPAPDRMSGQVTVELLDASNVVVQQELVVVEAGQLIFRVASSSLEEGKVYQVIVRAPGITPANPVLIFRAAFEEERTSGSVSSAAEVDAAMAAVACGKLDTDLDRADDLRDQGNRQEAETAYAEALVTARANGCSYHQANAANGLGVLATQEWRLFRSLAYFDEAEAALTVLEESEGLEGDARALETGLEFNRGTSYFRLGWLDDAHDAFDRVQVLYLRDGVAPSHQANLLLQFARIFRFRDEPRKAREMVREALDLLASETPKLRASLWQEHARLDFEAGRFDAAEQAFDRALEALERVESRFAKANVFADIAELEVRRGRWAASLEWVDKTLDLVSATNRPDFNLEIHTRYVQSMAREGLGDLAGARRAAESGLALLESLREGWQDQGLHFFALREKHYRHRLELTEVSESPEDAWDVFENFRARGLLESVGRRARRPDEGGGKQLGVDQVERQRRELLEAVRQLDRLEPGAGPDVRARRERVFLAHRRTLRGLRAEQLSSAGLRPTPAVVDPQAAVAMLDAETLGLVFATSREGLHVLLLSPHGELEGVTLAADRPLEMWIAKLRDGWMPNGREENRAQLDEHIQNLSRALLGPIAEHLDRYRRLAIVVDGPLERLPFEALRHPRTERRLIESHEIAYLPSFSVLGALRAQVGQCQSPPSALLAVGDPVFGPRDLARWPAGVPNPRTDDEALVFYRLEATAGEVSGIAELYSERKIALGSEATRVSFLAEAPLHRIIHLASHAQSHRQIPERSKIALSCIDAEDRPAETCDLYFEDVVALDLCGQIIILSACDTAGGPPLAGEGILGLPRAFLRAGASTVVASLWPVPDEPTSELMVEFHRHLQSGEGPASALQKAKLELIASGHPPSVWAAFVLLGDWRTDPP